MWNLFLQYFNVITRSDSVTSCIYCFQNSWIAWYLNSHPFTSNLVSHSHFACISCDIQKSQKYRIQIGLRIFFSRNSLIKIHFPWKSVSFVSTSFIFMKSFPLESCTLSVRLLNCSVVIGISFPSDKTAKWVRRFLVSIVFLIKIKPQKYVFSDRLEPRQQESE